MLVIRRLVTREQGYTILMLPPDIYHRFPTTEHEHHRILQIYRQDRAHAGILNDFSEYGLPPAQAQPTSPS